MAVEHSSRDNLSGLESSARAFAPATAAGRAIAPMIDHTLLRPDATARQVAALCAEAKAYGFAAVCVMPARLAPAVQELAGSPVKPCTVISFPHGAATTAAKAREAAEAVGIGAREIDMVLAIGALKDGDFDVVRRDIAEVVQAAKPAAVKVIIETALLDECEKVTACRLAVEAGAAFVKTSTGTMAGVTVADVRLMRATVGPTIGVKASGGIRALADALAMIEAGASRLGTSAGVSIVTSQ